LLGSLFKLFHPFSRCELVWELANMQISASDNYLLFSVAVKRAPVVPDIKLVFSALKSVCYRHCIVTNKYVSKRRKTHFIPDVDGFPVSDAFNTVVIRQFNSEVVIFPFRHLTKIL
jgi:hypothetical protein